MAKVAVIVDNEKDLNYTENLKEVMDNLGISYEIKIISGMDSLEEIDKFLDEIEDKGVSVIIVLAGISTHLPGIIASKTIIPVIGVENETFQMDGGNKRSIFRRSKKGF